MGDDQKVGHGRFDPYLGKLEKTGLEGITAQAKEISRLRNRLAEIERRARELADQIGDEIEIGLSPGEDYANDVRADIEERLRAIIDGT